MSPIFAATLALHVIFGVVGVIASYAVLLFLLKRQASNRQLTVSSLTAFISYLLSWVSGGYYYVLYYGDEVKPVIKAGDYSWGHNVIMEAKEHVFLVLPFATLALAIAVCYGYERVNTDPQYKRSLILLSAVITAIATIITLSGILISGSAQ